MSQPWRLPRGEVVLETHAGQETAAAALRGIRAGLLRTPREIAPRYFYDDRGSELFDAITTLPEYYQTRTERALLETIAADVIEASGCNVLVELGSGTSTKTRALLDAMHQRGLSELYVPIDVNESVVQRAADELVQAYPGLCVHGVSGDFLQLQPALPRAGRRLVIFLGGTIGNLTPAAAQRFLQRLARTLDPGDTFLLGVDLIKDKARLEPAYNDSRGVTAAFNRNILQVLNTVADGDFTPERYDHLAFYAAEQHWIEMRLVSSCPQTVRLAAAGLVLEFRRGETIRTEISVKYDAGMVQDLLARAGFSLVQWFSDPEQLFGLALARRGEHAAAG